MYYNYVSYYCCGDPGTANNDGFTRARIGKLSTKLGNPIPIIHVQKTKWRATTQTSTGVRRLTPSLKYSRGYGDPGVQMGPKRRESLFGIPEVTGNDINKFTTRGGKNLLK